MLGSTVGAQSINRLKAVAEVRICDPSSVSLSAQKPEGRGCPVGTCSDAHVLSG